MEKGTIYWQLMNTLNTADELIQQCIHTIIELIGEHDAREDIAALKRSQFTLTTNREFWQNGGKLSHTDDDVAPMRAAENEKQSKWGILILTEKEIFKMPKEFKTQYRAGKIVAHVRRKENGVYEIRCQVKKHSLSASSKNLEEAKRKFTEKVTNFWNSFSPSTVAQPKKSITLGAYMLQWLDTVKKPFVKPITYKDYMLSYKANICPTFGNRAINGITQFELQAFLNSYVEQGKNRTALKLHQILTALFEYAVIDDLVKKSPMQKVVLPRYEQKNGTALLREEEKRLVNLLRKEGDSVVPYINDKSTAGQDLLNLFFTTFNKYIGKSDKNQAFTPDHICDFMSKAVGVNKHSRVLDPCCGSGAFLVRAMTDAMDDCDTEEERELVRKNQIFGIEYEEGAFGLSSTNMLIHGDGNSNVVQDSMFRRAQWIADNNINIVLMNPPYNATKKCCDPNYTKGWDPKKKEDPSKGLHFVEWIARQLPSTCKIAVLLPMQAAIGNSGDIKQFKKKMLDSYTLDAVFSLPSEMFYPGASVVACCMIFDLSQKHEKANRDTFFGYFKNDNFIKRKGLGRIERTDAQGNGLWAKTKEYWLDLYRNKREVAGMSVMRRVTWSDEWLAEAYMETDYSTLSANDFQNVLNEYLAYLVQEGTVYED